MFVTARLDQAAAELDAIVRDLDVDRLALGDAKALVGVFARVARQADAAVALLGARVADAARSDREAERWLATQTRSGRREARDRLRAGLAVRATEATRRAAQSGDLSMATASAIGAAATEDPACEARLLALAADGAADDVVRAAHQARRAARAESEAAAEQRRHRQRSLTAWVGDDGGIAGRFQTTCTQWAPISGTLATLREAAFARARRTDERADRGSAYDMDALALMAHLAAGGAPAELGYTDADLPAALRHRLTEPAVDRRVPAAHDERGARDGADRAGEPEPGDGRTHDERGAGDGADRAGDLLPGDGREPEGDRRGAPGAMGDGPPTSTTEAAARRLGATSPPGMWKLIIRVDADALRRGHAEAGETCDIAGVGPVAVGTVRQLLPEAFVATIIAKGHDVLNVTHHGRRPTAHQATALQWYANQCCTRGCTSSARIQIDHDADWADTHVTWVPGLNGACDQCHARKTNQGWAWVGDPDGFNKRVFVPPDDPRHPDHTGQRPARPPTGQPEPQAAGTAPTERAGPAQLALSG